MGTNPKWLCISPHPDDICLSVGGIIRRIKQSDVEIHVATIFTFGNHSPYKNSTGKASDISNLRKKEETAYCKKNHLKSIYFNYPEIIFQSPGEDIFSLPIHHYPQFESVQKTLSDLITNNKYDLVFLPGGLGGHVEHRLMTNLFTSVEQDLICFYEDLPYAMDYSNSEIKNYFLSLGVKSKKVNIDRFVKDKTEDLHGYQSQISDIEIEKCLNHARKIGSGNNYFERIWGTDKSLDLVQTKIEKIHE